MNASQDAALGPEEREALAQTVEGLKKDLPWVLSSDERIRVVCVRAKFPRSKTGKCQDDLLLRRIYSAISQLEGNLSLRERADKIVELVTTAPYNPIELKISDKLPRDGDWRLIREFVQFVDSWCKCLSLHETVQPKTLVELFGHITERLNYLENFKPTIGDFAVEALQQAFIGLMKSKYDWSGLPTKGDVIAMAKELLERERKPGSKSSRGWSKPIKDAGLDFLPPGKAGRPPKEEVDKNLKAKQEVLSELTKYVHKVMGGDWSVLLDKLKPSFGGKKLFQNSEGERLNDQLGHSHLSDEE